jgi:S1-C subfamily serine protease
MKASPAVTWIMAVTFLTLVPAQSIAENSIARLENLRAAVVTVRARTLNAISDPQTSKALDPASGQIIILSGQRVQFNEQTGAGVIIDPSGVIVTNTHIIFGSQKVLVNVQDGRELEAHVLFVSPADDFSFLKVDDAMPFTSVEFADSQTISLGDDITTIGHSDLLNGTISGGVISGLGTRETEHGTEIELIRLNINHYQGDSGGPVFDRTGKLLGLMSSKSLSAQRELYAVPANKIHFAYINLDKSPQTH